MLIMMGTTMVCAQKTIATEGWDGASAKEVWSSKAVSWSIDWVTRYSDDTVERTPFTMSAPRGVKTLTEWNIPWVIFYEESSVEFSNLQVNLVSSTNESRTSDDAVFSWVNEKREISDKMTIHTWFDNNTVTPFLKEVLDKNRVWENKWEALDPFDCKVSYKNQEYLFGRKANAPEVSQKDSVTNYRWYSYGYKDEAAIRSDMLSYKVGDYIQNVPAIYSTDPGISIGTFMPPQWGWLYDVKQTVANGSKQNGFVYIWSLYFSNGILPVVVVPSSEVPQWNFSYFEYGASPLYNSAVYSDGDNKWVNAIASDDVDMMRWREAGPVMDTQDVDVAKQISWDEGHGTSVSTNRYEFTINTGKLSVYDSYSDKTFTAYDGSHQDEWGELVDVKQTLANDDRHKSFVYVLSLHFSKGYVMPAIITPGILVAQWKPEYCEQTPNSTYNSAYYDTTEKVWKNAIAYDYGTKMYWAREGAVLVSKKYDVAASQNWDEGHNASVFTERYDLSLASDGMLKATDSYTGSYMGFWDGGVPRSYYDVEYRDDIRTPNAYTAYMKVGKYGKIVWNGQEITAVDTESNDKQLTSEECKVPTWQFQIFPDEGFEVDSVGLNNVNITSYVSDNVLTLNTFARDIHLEFRFVKKDYIPIVFADPNVEALCLENWDLDGNGVLDRGEAATVESIGTVFRETDITSFEELQYFTGLTSIENKAFYGCKNLSKVLIPLTVTSIEGIAFSGCTSLTSLVIPESVTEIGNLAFYECSNLASITIPDKVKEIGRYTFYKCSNLKTVLLPEGLETIGELAFQYCTSLTSITIPKSVTSFARGAFQNTGLTSVTIPGNVVTVGPSSFYGCGSLASVTILDGVETVDTYAFNSCTNLVSLTIHGATELKENSFVGCGALSSVTSYAEEPAWFFPDEVFSSDAYTNAKLHVPAGKKGTYKSTTGWAKFTNVEELGTLKDGDTFEATAGSTTLRFKVLNAADKTCQVGADNRGDAIVSGGGNWDGTIPSKVTGSDYQEYTVIGIGNRAFFEYDGIESITLPETLQQISEGAFMRCHDLMYITIPAGVKTIGSLMLNGQEALKEVVSLIEAPQTINGTIDCGGRYGNNATLVVPAGKKSAYESIEGWKSFKRIVEMYSGDADGNKSVDEQDLNIVREYVMTGQAPEGFVRQNADTKSDNKVNVVDIVNIVNMIKNKK